MLVWDFIKYVSKCVSRLISKNIVNIGNTISKEKHVAMLYWKARLL